MPSKILDTVAFVATIAPLFAVLAAFTIVVPDSTTEAPALAQPAEPAELLCRAGAEGAG